MKTSIARYLLLSSVLSAGLCIGPTAVAQNSDEAEVLTRGPIHEAYANAAPAEREASQVVSRKPPAAIDELPPDQKPEGDNVTWIGGYWAWDDGYDDFIWVSGVWRDIPPDRQWIPGYWADAAGGFQYVPGYWDELERRTSEYLPTPPQQLDYGPSSPAPSGNYVWAPGTWRWVDRSYYWQPGYWVVTQPNWVWTPSYYVWTPRGYVFVAGYWDYDLPRRGVCYAPVYYREPYYRHADYYYTPRLAIDINIAIGHFFVRSNSCHYYFGDYYGDRYRRRGYDPWYSVHGRRDRYYHYDPIFVTYRERELRRDRDWDRHMEERYEYRREHSDARPPRTLVAAQDIERRKLPQSVDRNDLVIAKPAEQVIERTDRSRPMGKIDMQNRRQLQARSRDMEEFRTERQQIEAQPRQAENAPETVNRTRTARGPERATVKSPSHTTQEPAQPQAQREDQQRTPQQAQPQPAPQQPERAQQPNEPRRTASTPHESPPQRTGQSSREQQPREQARTEQAQREQQPQQPQVQRSERQPEERTLRQSPVASRPDKSTRQAPKKPEIPQPSARAPEAKDQQPAQQPEQRSGKGRGVGKQEEKAKGQPR